MVVTQRIALLALLLAGCATHDRPAGGPCDSDDDCVAGTTCSAAGWADGALAYICVTSCGPEDGFRCAGGELCWYTRGDRSDVFGCYPGGDGALGAACTQHGECALGLMCGLSATEPVGACVPGCDLGPCAAGQACRYPGDCAYEDALVCGPVLRDGVPGGACLPSCTTEGRPLGLCDDGSTCLALDGSGASSLGACLPGGDVGLGGACVDQAECALGLGCVLEGSSATCDRMCNTDADCDGGRRCDVWVCT